jgi:hypothetical protein
VESNLVDLGPGNIKLGSAIALLKKYNDIYPNSDPLQAKKYNNDYRGLAWDLSRWNDLETTAKFSVLDAAEAVPFFDRRAHQTWASADKFEKLGLVSTYFNRGREKMNQVASEEKFGGQYEPAPAFGGPLSAEHGPALSAAIDARHQALEARRRAAAMARQVPIGSVSSARPFGESGTIRVGHETNALDVIGEEGLLRNFPRRPGSLVPNIDPVKTRSVVGGTPRARRLSGLTTPAPNPADSVAAYARLIGAMLGRRPSARPFGASQNGQTVSNGQGADDVTLTRMIREMQRAGASADEIRQMISENRQRAARNQTR